MGRVTEENFVNSSSFWVKYFRLMVTPVQFYTFYRGRSLIYVRGMLLFILTLFASFVEYFVFVLWTAQ